VELGGRIAVVKPDSAETRPLWIGPIPRIGQRGDQPAPESLPYSGNGELIGVEIFRSMKEAEAMGGDWREGCKKRRPDSPLGYLTPAALAAR